MAKRKKHLYFSEDWFVFPLAIEWTSDTHIYLKPTSRLVIHFMWWHWQWIFEKGD